MTNERAWLAENFFCYDTTKELTKEFNEHFGLNRSSDSVRSTCSILGLKRSKANIYTQEQDEYIVKNYGCAKSSEFALMFNERFGCNVTGSAIMQRANKLGAKLKDRYVFGIKGAYNKREELSETTDRKGNVLIKANGKWIFKSRYIYEEAFGAVRNDEQVIFADGNHRNFSLENLLCVNRRTFLTMTGFGWFCQNAELTKSAIAFCELHNEIGATNYDRA